MSSSSSLHRAFCVPELMNIWPNLEKNITHYKEQNNDFSPDVLSPAKLMLHTKGSDCQKNYI